MVRTGLRAKMAVLATAALLLAGCAPAVTQRFDASPTATYWAFEQSWGSPSETLQEVDGKTVPIRLDFEKDEGKSLRAFLTVDGEEAARLKLTMNPAEGGKATDVAGEAKINSPLFWKAMGEKDGPEINDLAASVALKALLAKSARIMKEDGTLGRRSPFAELGASSRSGGSSDPDIREAQTRQQMREATRPMTDTQGSETAGASTAPMLDPSAAARSGGRGY